MLVKISKTIFEEVNLSDDIVAEIVERRLMQLITPGEYMVERDEKLIIMCDDHRSKHGTALSVYVRDATELDKAVFKVLKEIKKSP